LRPRSSRSAPATFEDVEAEIGEAVDYVVHIERQPGRRFIREVLRVDDYDRRTQQFQLERVFRADAQPLIEVNPTPKESEYAVA
jgi:pilus assembly protein CpaF